MTDNNCDLSLFIYVRTDEKLYENGAINESFHSLRESVMFQFAKLTNTYKFTTPGNLIEYKITTNDEPLPVNNVLCLMVSVDTKSDEPDVDLEKFIQELASESFKMESNVIGAIIKKHKDRNIFVQCSNDCTDDEHQLIVYRWKTL